MASCSSKRMNSAHVLVGYGVVCVALGAIAHVGVAFFAWSLPRAAVLMALCATVLALHAARARFWLREPPLVQPRPGSVLAVRLGILLLAVGLVLLGWRYQHSPSDSAAEGILIGSFMLIGGTVGAIAAVGIDAALGRLLAAAIRTPFHVCDRLFDGAARAVEEPFRARIRARHRARRRKERRPGAAGLRDDGQSCRADPCPVGIPSDFEIRRSSEQDRRGLAETNAEVQT